jgi:hypothetical protein
MHGDKDIPFREQPGSNLLVFRSEMIDPNQSGQEKVYMRVGLSFPKKKVFLDSFCKLQRA